MTEPPAFASSDLSLVRRNPWVLGLSLSPLLGALALVVSGVAAKPGLFILPFQLVFVGIALAYFAYRRNWRPVVTKVSVRAGPDGVTVGDLFLPRGEIRAGFVLPGSTTEAPRVILRRRLRPEVQIQVWSTEEGRALLHALGLDASQTVAVFRTASLVLAKRRYGIALGAGLALLWVLFVQTIMHLPDMGRVVMIGAPFLIVLSAILSMMPSRFSVGADGIVLRWLWVRRFVGYDDITGVTRFDRGWGSSRVLGLSLALRSGGTVELPVSQSGRLWGDPAVTLALVEERIREAREAFRHGGTAADAALLRRGERDVGAWVTALRSIGAGANADLRTAPLPRESLFRIVEDPAAHAADRAAAAVALGSDLDDESKARLRSAAEATAAPRLRIAIEKAAGGDGEAELEAALAEIDGERGEARGRAS
jgi:hypothetical protein